MWITETIFGIVYSCVIIWSILNPTIELYIVVAIVSSIYLGLMIASVIKLRSFSRKLTKEIWNLTIVILVFELISVLPILTLIGIPTKIVFWKNYKKLIYSLK